MTAVMVREGASELHVSWPSQVAVESRARDSSRSRAAHSLASAGSARRAAQRSALPATTRAGEEDRQRGGRRGVPRAQRRAAAAGARYAVRVVGDQPRQRAQHVHPHARAGRPARSSRRSGRVVSRASPPQPPYDEERGIEREAGHPRQWRERRRVEEPVTHECQPERGQVGHCRPVAPCAIGEGYDDQQRAR